MALNLACPLKYPLSCCCLRKEKLWEPLLHIRDGQFWFCFYLRFLSCHSNGLVDFVVFVLVLWNSFTSKLNCFRSWWFDLNGENETHKKQQPYSCVAILTHWGWDLHDTVLDTKKNRILWVYYCWLINSLWFWFYFIYFINREHSSPRFWFHDMLRLISLWKIIDGWYYAGYCFVKNTILKVKI